MEEKINKWVDKTENEVTFIYKININLLKDFKLVYFCIAYFL
jgi:hypothetical protein